MGKISDFIEDVRDTIGIVLAAPAVLRTTGAVTKGIGSTISNTNVSTAVKTVGRIIGTAGVKLGQLYKGIATKFILPGAKAAAKTLPGSKVVTSVIAKAKGPSAIGAILRSAPVVATAAASLLGAIKATKLATELKSIMSNPLAKLQSDAAKFDVKNPASWWNLAKDTLTLK